MPIKWDWYWFHFQHRPLPVSVHLDDKTRRYDWSRIHGIQIGRWFIGVVKGESADVE